MKDQLKLGAIASAALVHTACLCAGVYKGNANARGINVDLPFRYLWGSNIALTGIGFALNEEPKSTIEKIISGSFLGAITAPIEFTIGWGIGFAAEYISQNVFY